MNLTVNRQYLPLEAIQRQSSRKQGELCFLSPPQFYVLVGHLEKLIFVNSFSPLRELLSGISSSKLLNSFTVVTPTTVANTMATEGSKVKNCMRTHFKADATNVHQYTINLNCFKRR
jgi:hypothetical protein